jgi:hypothetical protein
MPQQKWNNDDKDILKQEQRKRGAQGRMHQQNRRCPNQIPCQRHQQQIPNCRAREQFLFFLHPWYPLNQFPSPLCSEESKLYYRFFMLFTC